MIITSLDQLAARIAEDTEDTIRNRLYLDTYYDIDTQEYFSFLHVCADSYHLFQAGSNVYHILVTDTHIPAQDIKEYIETWCHPVYKSLTEV